MRQKLAQVPESTAFIHRVPNIMRKGNEESYDPCMVSNGPYHHGKDELKYMEIVKEREMIEFLEENSYVPLPVFVQAIENLENRAHDAYAEPIRMKREDFLDMILIDGVFVLKLILNKGTTEIQTTMDRVLLSDLLLVENQIPMFVLNQISQICRVNQDVLISKTLSYLCPIFPGGMVCNTQELKRPHEIQHIMDTAHSNWYPRSAHNSAPQAMFSFYFRIPSATQLRLSRVKFTRRVPRATSSIYISFFDVRFMDMEGTFGPVAELWMPTMVFGEEEVTMFKNMIAYEQRPADGNHMSFTDYVALLSCLVRSPDDLRILCDIGIIRDLYGSTTKVLKIVDNLYNGVHYCSTTFKYNDMFTQINAHFMKSKSAVSWGRYLVDFRREYFKNPWTVIKVMAASMLLILTILSTVFTGLQTFQKH